MSTLWRPIQHNEYFEHNYSDTCNPRMIARGYIMVVEMLLPGHMHCGGCYWSNARTFAWFREEQADDGIFPMHSSVLDQWRSEIAQTGFAQSTLNGKWLTKVVSRKISYGYLRHHRSNSAQPVQA